MHNEMWAYHYKLSFISIMIFWRIFVSGNHWFLLWQQSKCFLPECSQKSVGWWLKAIKNCWALFKAKRFLLLFARYSTRIPLSWAERIDGQRLEPFEKDFFVTLQNPKRKVICQHLIVSQRTCCAKNAAPSVINYITYLLSMGSR